MRLLDSVLMTMGLSQPFRRFRGEVLMLLVIVPGRATFLNLSRYSAYSEKTFRRWCRHPLDWTWLKVMAIRAVVPGAHEAGWAFDPSFIPPSGKGTAGLGRFWHGTAGRAEPGLEMNTWAWVDVNANTAYTLSAELTPAEPATAAVPGANAVTPTTPTDKDKGKGVLSTAEGVEASRGDAYLAHLQRVIPHHNLVTLRSLTADGYCSKVQFVDGIKAWNWEWISKWRRDADLRYLYQGP